MICDGAPISEVPFGLGSSLPNMDSDEDDQDDEDDEDDDEDKDEEAEEAKQKLGKRKSKESLQQGSPTRPLKYHSICPC